ncbi:MAG: hypothetical protein HYX92_07645 [Chloroflexi bacterium]|nr:hypothetical protein [Chloroflexota bacterium]
MSIINVLDPRGELLEKPKKLAPRVSSLKGKVVGLISSGSGNSTEFMTRLGELLVEKEGVAEAIMRIKVSLALPLPEAQTTELHRRCQAIIVGVGVGGSNALSLVVDAVNAEMAGMPGVVIVGHEFEKLTKAKIRNMAFPTLDYVVVPSPMGTAEQAHDKAATALPDVVAIITKGRR